jgi:hypothetical protein
MLSTSLDITSFGEDDNGEIYLVEAHGGAANEGVLYQLVDPSPQNRRRAVRH